jgi:hypothetical protein
MAMGIFLFWGFAHGASAQSAPPQAADPHNLDIAGVKLGMTVDETIAALEKANPKYTVTKLYWASKVNTFGLGGVPLADVQNTNTGMGETLTTNFAFLTGIVAENGQPPCGQNIPTFVPNNPSNYNDFPCSNSNITAPYDVIDIWFSPVPGQEKTIAIVRYNSYYTGSLQGNFPSVAATKSAIFTKYSSVPSIADPGGEEFDWFFDGRGRFISADRVKELQSAGQNPPPELGGGLPRSTSPGDGITLSVVIEGPISGTSDSLGALESSLVDGNGLYLSVAQGEATYEAQKAKMDAQAPKNNNTPSL